MASHKAFLGWFLFFGLTAVGLHLAGFIYPGWISLRTNAKTMAFGMMSQRMEQAGLLGPGPESEPMGPMPPMMDGGDGRMPPPPPPRVPEGDRDHQRPPHGGRKHDGHRTARQAPKQHEAEFEMMEKPRQDADVLHEEFIMMEFVRRTVIEVEDFDLSMHYGLWFSKMCLHKKKSREMVIEDDVIEEDEIFEGDDVRTIEKRDASSSSSSEDGHHGKHGKHKRCHCKKLSTKCALKMAYLFEPPMMKPQHRLSAHNMGHASLKEHKIETTIGLILMFIGLIGGIASFRKPEGCRCVKLATIIVLLVCVVLVAVPVVRITMYSRHRFYHNDGVDIRCPISAILSSGACALTFLAAFVTFVGMVVQGRKERPGRWYQFNNEQHYEEEQKEKKGGPALVFYNDDEYPVKAGLVDAVDFNDVKPEIDEPEKKPLE